MATITSTAPVVDATTGSNLELTVLDRDGNARSEPTLVDASWERYEEQDGKGGWVRRGTVAVPDSLRQPGAVLVRKIDDDDTDAAHRVDYILGVKLATHEEVHTFPASSWVSSQDGKRVFFEGSAYLPQHTPPALREQREQDLKSLRCANGPAPKEVYDRAYGYQVYDDLGNAKAPRPALGGSAELPYPRHLSNNLAAGTNGPGKPWLPFDEQFDSSKQQGFNGDLLKSVGSAVAQGIKNIDNRSQFTSFDDVLQLYRKGPPGTGTGPGATDSVSSLKGLDLDEASLSELDDEAERDRLGPLARIQSKLASAVQQLNFAPKWKDLLKFEAPRVLAGRGLDVVLSDEEWGRQALAGMHPSTVTALKRLPSDFGSAIGPEHVDEELAALGGAGLNQLVADAVAGEKPRLYLLDYWLMDTFWAEAPPDAEGRTEHAGRALFFLQQSAEGQELALVPIAIELKHKQTQAQEAAAGRTLPDTAGIVYSRQQLKKDANGQALWFLAKAILRSLDSAYHQLISHWLRTHCAIEPYLIAMRRQMSIMHPVFKLMAPHYRFTLDINFKGRGSLINAGGIIESVFTPGAYAMRLSSVAYKSWRFRLQKPAADLEARGLLDKDGNVWVQDYPYAKDGLEVYAELEKYFTEYCQVYYKSDADVAEDTELQAWWAEVKSEGHPDIALIEPDEEAVWGFKGPIPSVDVLVQVLATIAWVASAHHAAVNFGQYDMSGLLLNASSLIRRPMPHISDPGDPARQALFKAVGKGQKALEKELLTYLSDPVSALVEMVTVRLLSIHADGEQTLDERNYVLTDPAAVAANLRFVSRMQALEARMLDRNSDPEAWARYAKDKKSMGYTLLVPPSPAGLTFKGVPYSVSI